MRNLILITLLISGLGSFAEITNPKLKNVQFDIRDIGHLRIKYDAPGEPIVQPERVQILITCKNSNHEYRFKIFRLCNWENYSYEPETKMLTLKFSSGRVDMNTGEVVCDQFDENRVDLSSACKTK